MADVKGQHTSRLQCDQIQHLVAELAWRQSDFVINKSNVLPSQCIMGVCDCAYMLACAYAYMHVCMYVSVSSVCVNTLQISPFSYGQTNLQLYFTKTIQADVITIITNCFFTRWYAKVSLVDDEMLLVISRRKLHQEANSITFDHQLQKHVLLTVDNVKLE